MCQRDFLAGCGREYDARRETILWRKYGLAPQGLVPLLLGTLTWRGQMEDAGFRIRTIHLTLRSWLVAALPSVATAAIRAGLFGLLYHHQLVYRHVDARLFLPAKPLDLHGNGSRFAADSKVQIAPICTQVASVGVDATP